MDLLDPHAVAFWIAWVGIAPAVAAAGWLALWRHHERDTMRREIRVSRVIAQPVAVGARCIRGIVHTDGERAWLDCDGTRVALVEPLARPPVPYESVVAVGRVILDARGGWAIVHVPVHPWSPVIDAPAVQLRRLRLSRAVGRITISRAIVAFVVAAFTAHLALFMLGSLPVGR